MHGTEVGSEDHVWVEHRHKRVEVAAARRRGRRRRLLAGGPDLRREQGLLPVRGDVAAPLVELTLGEPSGLVPDMGGPRVYGAAELLRGYLRTTQRRRLILPVWLPGKAARELRAGANLAP
jgi:hypothetical protein